MTQQQIDRLQKLQAALGQKPEIPAGLTGEDAAGRIADLARRFNAQSRQATQGRR